MKIHQLRIVSLLFSSDKDGGCDCKAKTMNSQHMKLQQYNQLGNIQKKSMCKRILEKKCGKLING